MYQAKTSQNKALLMRKLVNLKLQRETTVAEHTSEFQSLVNQLTSVDLQFDDEMQALLLLSSLPESWETLVVSLSNSVPNGKLTTSMVMNALFNKEARRREMGSTDQSESQALVSYGSRERSRGQGRGHHRDIAETAVMAVDESEVLLAASDNGKSDWACEGRIWMANNTSSRVVGRGSVRFRMADGKSVTLTELLRLVEEFSEFPRETRRCCGERRLEGYTDWRGMSRQEELLSDMGLVVISKKSGQGKQPLHRSTQSKRRGTWGIRNGTWRIRSDTRAQERCFGIFVRTREERWSHDNSQSDVLCGAPRWGGWGHPSGRVQGTSVKRCRHFGVESYGGAGSEAIRKDNLKTSDYPPVGWRGRLLSPAHLDSPSLFG
ncbi:hypothetical protein Acr_00g0033520 [Actinidia rufa]|uniref:Uncharacterized protein n=1 Tax=Actinidia rufa TaxID=165716 RepID=A0A7J0DGV7_9ERIC|nr:hypothetical protein Acr_00g0033520 [Actinidia rufa]